MQCILLATEARVKIHDGQMDGVLKVNTVQRIEEKLFPWFEQLLVLKKQTCKNQRNIAWLL